MVKNIRDHQCSALKTDLSQCTRTSSCIVYNVISGTGVGKFDWVYGRPVTLCRQHWCLYQRRRYLYLIEGGVLQTYNKHKYGSVVLKELIDWSVYKGEKKDISDYWRNKPKNI